MDRVTLWEARADLKALIDRAAASNRPIAIERRRGPGAVLLPAALWAQIEETLQTFDKPDAPMRLLARLAEHYAGLAGEPGEVEISPASSDPAGPPAGP